MDAKTSTYRVILSGAIYDGKTLPEVATAIARLLKIDEHKSVAILSSGRTVIKSGLSRETAERYWNAFNSTGAVTKIENDTDQVLETTNVATTNTPQRKLMIGSLFASFALGAIIGGIGVWAINLPPDQPISATSPPSINIAALTTREEETALPQEDTDTQDWAGQCSKISELAETIMKSRQSGMPMSKMMEIVDDANLGQAMIIAAYDSPRYSVDSYISDAIKDFRDTWYLQCAKALRK